MLLFEYSTLAKLHNVAVCVTNRKYSEIGGTPFSPSYTWSKDYEILPDATKCACDLYKQRNTGSNQWDQCPDCTFVRSFYLFYNRQDNSQYLGWKLLQFCRLAYWRR